MDFFLVTELSFYILQCFYGLKITTTFKRQIISTQWHTLTWGVLLACKKYIPLNLVVSPCKLGLDIEV